MEVESAEVLAERLGVERDTNGLLAMALVHPSYTPEYGLASNQRLEFLGDAVLDLVAAEALYLQNPDMNEGDMSKARIALVNETTLAEIAQALGLAEMLAMGRGADQAQDRYKPSVLSDGLEAVFGAIYLGQGLEAARTVIVNLLGPRIADAAKHPGAQDFKSQLNEWASVAHGESVNYDVSVSGADHDRQFVATVRLGDRVLGSGEGRSKKAAETEAAKAAWKVVQSA